MISETIISFMAGKQLALWDNLSLEKGIRCLLTMELDTAIGHNDMTACIGYRKQLKSLAPELYDAYFNLLKSEKA